MQFGVSLMKRLLILIPLLLLPTSAQAITWKEFFDAIKEHQYDHLFPVHATNKTVTCIQIVTWEEYVQGSGHYKGYVRSQSNKFHIPCP